MALRVTITLAPPVILFNRKDDRRGQRHSTALRIATNRRHSLVLLILLYYTFLDTLCFPSLCSGCGRTRPQ